MTGLRYLSVCSGIEAATVAWHPLGWIPAAFSEIEAFPRAVLKHHYPDVPCHGDFTTIGADEYGPIDLLVGGTPCQSFSIAGLRGGLADDRGNLALEFLRLADRTRPRWLVWENVPGVLSSGGGRDFGSILGGLVELGYGFAYRVLDAQHFGVPQRRRRVFVVGYLGDWRRAAAVLFEHHSLQGHPAPRRETGTPVAALTANGVGTCGADDNQGQAGHLIDWPAEIAPILNAHFGDKMGLENQHALNGAGHFVAHSLRGEGFDASEDGTGRGTPIVPCYGLATQQEPKWSEEVCPTLTVPSKSGGGQPHCVAFTAKDHGADAMEDCSPTLRAGGFTGSHANGGVMPAVAFNITPSNSNKDYNARQSERSQAITGSAGNAPSARGGDVIIQSAVRRLTPEECEALQGFPRKYTAIPYRGKPASECPDGPRYKALGNSMAVPCMAWIGRRIAQVEHLRTPTPIDPGVNSLGHGSAVSGGFSRVQHEALGSANTGYDHV